jgi:hypothetical protein
MLKQIFYHDWRLGLQLQPFFPRAAGVPPRPERAGQRIRRQFSLNFLFFVRSFAQSTG